MQIIQCRPLILSLGLLSSLGCFSAQKQAPSPQKETPSHQFTLEGTRIEERRAGKILWTGTGDKAHGDFKKATFTGLKLTRTPQNPGELPITVLSEIAHLALESGEAKFSKVVITDPMGRVLRAGDAEYRESEQVITSKGPMSFVADGFKVTGTNSSVNLESGQLLIAGPIEGSFTPKRRRP